MAPRPTYRILTLDVPVADHDELTSVGKKPNKPAQGSWEETDANLPGESSLRFLPCARHEVGGRLRGRDEWASQDAKLVVVEEDGVADVEGAVAAGSVSARLAGAHGGFVPSPRAPRRETCPFARRGSPQRSGGVGDGAGDLDLRGGPQPPTTRARRLRGSPRSARRLESAAAAGDIGGVWSRTDQLTN